MERTSTIDSDDSQTDEQLLLSATIIDVNVAERTRPQSDFYAYEPLPSQGDWIRLVQILSNNGKNVRCSIQAVELESATYTCLSYEWGRATRDQRVIMLDDKPFRVRYNLYDFLKTAQDMPEYTDTNFWIDAICIDQTNVHEKNDQVAKMGSIFRNKLVVAWLGISLELSATRSEEMAVVSRRLRSFSYEWPLYDPPNSSRSLVGKNPFPYRELLQDLDFLLKLGNQSYWQRAWILQELKLARAVILLSHTDKFDLQSLSDRFVRSWVQLRVLEDSRSAFLGFQNSFLEPLKFRPFLPPPSNSSNTSHESPYYLEACKRLSTQGQSGPLSGLLKTHKSLLCSKKHDKIYSLRSLAPEGEFVNVDYAQANSDLLLSTLNAFKDGFCMCTILDMLEILFPSYADKAELSAYLESPSLSRVAPTLHWRFSNHVRNAHSTVLRSTYEAQDELSDPSTMFARRNPSMVAINPNAAWFTASSMDLSTVCKNLRFAWTIGTHSDGGGEVFTYSRDHGRGSKLGSILEVKRSDDEADRIDVTLAISLARFCGSGYGSGYEPCVRRNTNLVPFTVNDIS